MGILYKSKNWVIKWSVCGKTGEFSWRNVSDRPIILCFDVIMITFPGEAPSGDETPSDERDITLLLPHKTLKGLTFYTGIFAI